MSRKPLSGAKSVRMRFDVTGMEAYIDALEGRAAEAIKPAAAAGAKVLYDGVKMNVAALGRVTGNLERSIYRTLSQSNSNDSRTVYHVSWNHIKAPHGHLVEYGYMQRYRTYALKNGQIRTMVRPDKVGTPRPSRNAPQSVKNAYYVPLETPRHIPGRAFVRSAAVLFPAAQDAAEQVFYSFVLGN